MVGKAQTVCNDLDPNHGCCQASAHRILIVQTPCRRWFLRCPVPFGLMKVLWKSAVVKPVSVRQ